MIANPNFDQALESLKRAQKAKEEELVKEKELIRHNSEEILKIKQEVGADEKKAKDAQNEIMRLKTEIIVKTRHVQDIERENAKENAHLHGIENEARLNNMKLKSAQENHEKELRNQGVKNHSGTTFGRN